MRGQSYVNVGNLSKSLDDYNNAITLNPSYIEPYLSHDLVDYVNDISAF